MADRLVAIVEELSEVVDSLVFSAPVTHVYNPLDYARAAHIEYLERYCSGRRDVVFLGMNPGPWGMAQTGVPFGEVQLVRDWLGIDVPVERPALEHPKRPVQGFECRRREVSGRRLWGWARDRFGTPEAFFERFAVLNYCPLMFLMETGGNLTPDRLVAADRAPLFRACDRALMAWVEILDPRWVIGIGRFAENRARAALKTREVEIGRALHPSPASPAANRGWVDQWERDLGLLGISLDREGGPLPFR